jgi:PhzF family phenazine biosynthesis protein
MISKQFFILDSFSYKKFSGNPTAVCVSDAVLSNNEMQNIAKEFNLPVTAFINSEKKDWIDIRYFTTTTEIPACGHATLATASVVSNLNNSSKFSFKTIENRTLPVEIKNDIIYLHYPVFKTQSYTVSKEMEKALGLAACKCFGYCAELETVFIELSDENSLHSIKPDFAALKKIEGLIEVVITTKASEGNYDYLLRSFCPWIGIDEDPVTGSVHSVLGNYWSEKLSKKELTAYQASERGGEIFIQASDDTIRLGGKVVTVMKGEIL